MLFNLEFHSSFFKVINSHFLIPGVITQTFNPIAELAISTGRPIKETKAEMKTHPVTIETKIRKCSI